MDMVEGVLPPRVDSRTSRRHAWRAAGALALATLAVACSGDGDRPTPDPTIPSPSPTAEVGEQGNDKWEIRSVSYMKETKDRVCNPWGAEQIGIFVQRAKELGATHVTLETPYDNPVCDGAREGNFSIDYTKQWIDEIRAHDLGVWHRHMFIPFEGIYRDHMPLEKRKEPNLPYADMVAQYIADHPDFFQRGDVFTLMPEPQNGGIEQYGTKDCGPSNVCIFPTIQSFNDFLVVGLDAARAEFAKLGLEDDITFSCCGFDGYMMWGDNNPDHQGRTKIDSRIGSRAIFSIDHYPAPDSTMEADLREFRYMWGNVPIIVEEWGATRDDRDPVADIEESLTALREDPHIIGVGYWQGGPQGHEGLLTPNLRPNASFTAVQEQFAKAS